MTGHNYLRGRTRLRGCKHLLRGVKDDDFSFMSKKPLVHTKTYEQQHDKIMKASYQAYRQRKLNLSPRVLNSDYDECRLNLGQDLRSKSKSTNAYANHRYKLSRVFDQDSSGFSKQ